MRRKILSLGMVGVLLLLIASFCLPFKTSASGGALPPPPGCQAAGNCANAGSEQAQTYCGNSDTIPADQFIMCTTGYDGAGAGKSKEQACKKWIGHTGTASCFEGWEHVRYYNIDYGGTEWEALCEKLKDIKGENLSKDNCDKDVLKSQAKLDAAVQKICDKYGKDELKAQCKAYDTAKNPTASKDGVACDNDESPLTWIVCPVVEGFGKVIEGLDGLITDQLSVGSPDGSSTPNEIFCDSKTPGDYRDACKAYKAAWASFRNIALGLIVITALIVVIAQAMGSEFLDAYTIRKMLPRIVAISIAITLSWVLMQFFVQFTNDLGYGIRDLMLQPFTSAGLDELQIDSGGAFAISIIGGAALGALGVFGLLSFALTGLLAVLIAFLVLIVRQIAIIIMVIGAPIALVLYILPNTERYYKIWWESFAKALIMFPIIMAFITIGRIFAGIASQSGSQIGQILAFAAYFAPYFMIPMTFRMAGATMGALGNFINERGKPLSEGLRQYRGRKRSENWEATKNFSRFSDRHPLGRVANTVGGAVANPTSMMRRHPVRGLRSARSAAHTTHGAELLKNNAVFQANAGDDNFLLAVANRDLARRKTEEARARSQDMSLSSAERSEAQQELYARERAMDAVGQMGSDASSIAARSAAFQELNKTGFQWSAGEKGYAELHDTARQLTMGVGGDERTFAGMMDQAQYHLRSSGQRFDLAGINHAVGYDPKTGTNKASLYELANAKPQSIQGMMEGLNLDATTPSQEHAIVYKELQAMLPNSKGASRDAIVQQIENLENFGIKSYLDQGTGQVITENVRDRAGNVVTRQREQTQGELAEKSARTYERPDPNRL